MSPLVIVIVIVVFVALAGGDCDGWTSKAVPREGIR